MLRFLVLLLTSVVMSPVGAMTFYTEYNPPMNFKVDGKVSGWATEVVVEMARRAGVPADVVLGQWDEGYARAKDAADACIYSTVRRPERFKLFQWVGPIGRGRYTAFGLEGFSQTVSRVDDLKAFRVGVVDDARAAYLRQRGFPNLVVAREDALLPGKLTLDPAKAGAIDLWVTRHEGARTVAKLAGAGAIKEVFADILNVDYWLACSLQVPQETVRALMLALMEMQKDGTLKKLADPTRFLDK
ncbi:MAG: transporter substrate-binding domain-containing protein [Proteobacteria bacterium]|nr:transporter substrate-binding domain-containing protein [Pseudomonadota bacterium]